jgi:hypothetical protein
MNSKGQVQKKPDTFTTYTDIYLRSTFWAMVILFNFGVIAIGTFWFIFNVIQPSVENAKAKKETGRVIEISLINTTNEKQYI